MPKLTPTDARIIMASAGLPPAAAPALFALTSVRAMLTKAANARRYKEKGQDGADRLASFAAYLQKTALSDLEPNRVEVVWSPPLPDPAGRVKNLDAGGYVFRIYRDGRKIVGGTSHASADLTADRALGYARDKGVIAAQVVIISRGPRDPAPAAASPLENSAAC